MTPKELVRILMEMPEDGMGYSKVKVTLQSGETFPAVGVGCHMIVIPTSDIVKVEHDDAGT